MVHSLAMHQTLALNVPQTHTEPEIPLGVDEAHLEMQVHIECDASSCPRKAAAVRTLTEAGRMVPSTTHLQWSR